MPNFYQLKKKMMALQESVKKKLLMFEILGAIFLLSFIFMVSGQYDLLESLVEYSRKHEALELDELIVTTVGATFLLLVIVVRRWLHIRRLQKELNNRYQELKAAQNEIAQLKGIVPICSSCKKIRDDQGFWQQVEQYIEKHSDARFSHGMCPECLVKFYGNEPWFQKVKKQ